MSATNVAPLTLLIGAQAISEAIANITDQGKKLDEYIQYTALSVLNHVELHGDVSVACRLYNGMPKGSRRAALAEFLMAFGKLVPNTDRAKAKEFPFLFGRDKATLLAEAQQRPWYNFKPERSVADCFDLQAALQSLLGRAKKAGSVSDPEALVELERMAQTVKPALPATPPAEVTIEIPPALQVPGETVIIGTPPGLQ